MGKTYRHYDEETGVSLVTIKDEYGTFEGRAKVHEDDRDLQSEFTGMTIAELQAKIKRATRRKNLSKKAMIKANREAKRTMDHYDGRCAVEADLKKELAEYLEDKESFRKNYRKLQARKPTEKGKNK